MQGRRTEAKLGDLGLAKLIPEGHLALQHTLPATPLYSAPEVLQAQLSWRLRTKGRRDQFHTQVSILPTPSKALQLSVSVILSYFTAVLEAFLMTGHVGQIAERV